MKVINLPNGDVDKGAITGKVKQGFGIYRYANGDVYMRAIGKMINNKAMGSSALPKAVQCLWGGSFQMGSPMAKELTGRNLLNTTI